MAELKIYLSDSLNERFRQIAMSVYGYGRGSLSRAAEEALTKWCTERGPSVVPEKSAGHAQSPPGDVSKEAGPHVNPDERESVGHASGLAESPSPNSIRPSD